MSKRSALARAAARAPARKPALAPVIPIRPIGAEYRPQLRRHFLALDAEDRYLRFGYAASDEQIGRYVDGIDFAHDEVFGVFSRKLELLAVAHLAIGQARAEFGVSVLPRARGLGIGTRLFRTGALHARNRGLRQLFMQCLSSNTAMRKIARRAGMAVRDGGGQTEAYLELPPDDWRSHLQALVDAQTGYWDYALKLFMRQWRCFWLFGPCPQAAESA